MNINASSELGIDGVIEINNPNVDPLSGIVLSSEKPQNTSDQIIAGCSTDQGNRFVVNRKGGLPNNPIQSLGSEIVWEDLRTTDDSPLATQKRSLSSLSRDDHQKDAIVLTTSKSSPKEKIQPAKSWIIKNDGTVILISEANTEEDVLNSQSNPRCQAMTSNP